MFKINISEQRKNMTIGRNAKNAGPPDPNKDQLGNTIATNITQNKNDKNIVYLYLRENLIFM
jgi:hypothetical protein